MLLFPIHTEVEHVHVAQVPQPKLLEYCSRTILPVFIPVSSTALRSTKLLAVALLCNHARALGFDVARGYSRIPDGDRGLGQDAVSEVQHTV